MQGRVCLVTGASSGIGREVAAGLAERGAAVVLVGRDPQRTAAARDAVRARAPGARVEAEVADLARMAEVRALAGRVRARYPALQVLVNNAGAVFGRRELTEEGLERTFALNHMAYFLLTNLLLPELQRGAPARVVCVASEAHRFGRMAWEDLQRARGYTAWGAYAQSKLTNVLYTRERARRLAGSGVTANCMHPGVVASGFGVAGGAVGLGMRLARPLLVSPRRGADTAVWLASAPELEGVTGGYFARRRERAPSRAACDPEAQRRLWAESARIAGLAG